MNVTTHISIAFAHGMRLAWIVLILSGLGMVGCDSSGINGGNPEDDPRPDVVATSTIIADLTAQIGGDAIDLTSILDPGADPHVYEPVPIDTATIEEAELILYNGFHLEPALIRLIEGTGLEAQKLAVGEVVDPIQNVAEGQQVPDPHVWGSAENAIAMTQAIRDALIELSPEHQAKFTQNADQLILQLEDLHQWIGDQIATIPADQRKLITTHDAFEYYAQAYGLEVVGTLIGISTEEQPSAQTVQRLVEAVREAEVPAIFAETTINPGLISTVAEEAEVNLASQQLYSDSIGAPNSEGDSYVRMMVANTTSIVENLGGQLTPFSSTAN